jgi:hypothetical protein
MKTRVCFWCAIALFYHDNDCNIIFDTVNCSYCKNDPEAKVQKEIINLINDKGEKERHRGQKGYRISRYRGIIPKLLEQYRNERFVQKDLRNNAMQLGQDLINGCYGLF